MHSYTNTYTARGTWIALGLEENVHREQLQSPPDLGPVFDKVERLMRVLGYCYRDIFAVHLAWSEAVLNAFRHGNRGNPSRPVSVSYLVTPAEVLVDVRDAGNGFDPAQVPHPHEAENRDQPCGRGIFLMQAYMSWVHFNAQGNQVTLCRRRTIA